MDARTRKWIEAVKKEYASQDEAVSRSLKKPNSQLSEQISTARAAGNLPTLLTTLGQEPSLQLGDAGPLQQLISSRPESYQGISPQQVLPIEDSNYLALSSTESTLRRLGIEHEEGIHLSRMDELGALANYPKSCAVLGITRPSPQQLADANYTMLARFTDHAGITAALEQHYPSIYADRNAKKAASVLAFLARQYEMGVDLTKLLEQCPEDKFEADHQLNYFMDRPNQDPKIREIFENTPLLHKFSSPTEALATLSFFRIFKIEANMLEGLLDTLSDEQFFSLRRICFALDQFNFDCQDTVLVEQVKTEIANFVCTAFLNTAPNIDAFGLPGMIENGLQRIKKPLSDKLTVVQDYILNSLRRFEEDKAANLFDIAVDLNMFQAIHQRATEFELDEQNSELSAKLIVTLNATGDEAIRIVEHVHQLNIEEEAQRAFLLSVTQGMKLTPGELCQKATTLLDFNSMKKGKLLRAIEHCEAGLGDIELHLKRNNPKKLATFYQGRTAYQKSTLTAVYTYLNSSQTQNDFNHYKTTLKRADKAFCRGYLAKDKGFFHKLGRITKKLINLALVVPVFTPIFYRNKQHTGSWFYYNTTTSAKKLHRLTQTQLNIDESVRCCSMKPKFK